MLKFAFVRSAFRWRLFLVLVWFCRASASVAFGQAIRDLPGFRSGTLERNDDASAGPVPMGFRVNFFGRTYSELYVNNNGNVTFQGSLPTYVPFGLAGTNVPIIAAFFADVDTRPSESGVVSYGTETVGGHQAFGVDYFRVGYFSNHSNHPNTFQIVLISRPDTGENNFDIEFNYAQVTWDLGDASGNVPAVVGFSNGTGQTNSSFQLPGSMSKGALLDDGPQSLIRGRLNSNVPGRYLFQVRSGVVRLLRITTEGLPEGTVARPYSSPPMATTGGVAPYAWSALHWPSELGLTLDRSTGVISGAPERAGTYNLVVQVTDQGGTSPAVKTFILTIKGGQQPLEIITEGLPECTVAVPYSSPPMAATGGVAPYAWSAVNWPSELGLTLNRSSGVISGTPARAGTYNLVVQGTDQRGDSPVTRTFSLTCKPGQQAAIAPYLIEPQEAVANTPVNLVAGLRFRDEGPTIPTSDLSEPTAIQVLIEGQAVSLHDDGLNGDQVAGDGRYTGQVTFRRAGNIPITIRATNSTLDRSVQGFVRVRFAYERPLELDLGTLTAGSESCRVLPLNVEQQAEILFEFRLLRHLPAEHTLLLRSAQRSYRPGEGPLTPVPGEGMQVCLHAGARAPSSEATGQSWIELLDTNGGTKEDLVAINLRWRVDGLTFWQRWWWLSLVFIALLLIALLLYGYIKPHRFPREMGVTFVPDYQDLDQSPQPLTQWPGVGIGFYRDARAFLHPDFRVSGKSRGALGMLKAEAGGVLVVPTDVSLYRELDVTEWEEIPSQGRPARAAVAYRIGERGPFFRISRGGKR